MELIPVVRDEPEDNLDADERGEEERHLPSAGRHRDEDNHDEQKDARDVRRVAETIAHHGERGILEEGVVHVIAEREKVVVRGLLRGALLCHDDSCACRPCGPAFD